MSGWTVTEESIQAMDNTKGRLTELEASIRQEIQKLKSVYEENNDGLGAHSNEIGSLIEEVEKAGEDASKPVLKLVLKLTRAAAIRRAHIENDPYKGNGRSR